MEDRTNRQIKGMKIMAGINRNHRIITYVILLGILVSLTIAGCAGPTRGVPEGEDKAQRGQMQPAKKPGDYFPLTRGSNWYYKGEGNEYASFSRTVIYTRNNRAQMRMDNGGTVGAEVVEVTDNAVTRIFFKGEEYQETNFLDEPPNDQTVLLKAPLEVGSRWGDPEGGSREIVDVNAAVSVPAGTFENCITVKITNSNSTLFEYYKDGVGLVKREFVSGDVRVTSSLEEFKINKSQ